MLWQISPHEKGAAERSDLGRFCIRRNRLLEVVCSWNIIYLYTVPEY